MDIYQVYENVHSDNNSYNSKTAKPNFYFRKCDTSTPTESDCSPEITKSGSVFLPEVASARRSVLTAELPRYACIRIPVAHLKNNTSTEVHLQSI